MAVVPVRGAGAEVRRLHGPGTPAGGDQQSRPGQPPAQPGRLGVRRFTALQRVPAHDADHPAPGAGLVQRVAHAVVVHGAQQRGVDVLLHGRVLVPREGPSVRRPGVAGLLHPGVQLGRVVQAGAVRVDRRTGHRGEDERTAVPEVLLEPVGQDAAEDDGTGGVAAEQHRLARPEVEALQAQAGQRSRAGEGGVQLRQRVHLPGRHAPHHGKGCRAGVASARIARWSSRRTTARTPGRTAPAWRTRARSGPRRPRPSTGSTGRARSSTTARRRSTAGSRTAC